MPATRLLDNNNKIFVNGIEKNDIWTVGLSAPIGTGTLGLSYGKLSIDCRDGSNGDSWGRGTMYTYPLSKRTALYAAYTYFDNDKKLRSCSDTGRRGWYRRDSGESNYTLGTGIRQQSPMHFSCGQSGRKAPVFYGAPDKGALTVGGSP